MTKIIVKCLFLYICNCQYPFHVPSLGISFQGSISIYLIHNSIFILGNWLHQLYNFCFSKKPLHAKQVIRWISWQYFVWCIIKSFNIFPNTVNQSGDVLSTTLWRVCNLKISLKVTAKTFGWNASWKSLEVMAKIFGQQTQIF